MMKDTESNNIWKATGYLTDHKLMGKLFRFFSKNFVLGTGILKKSQYIHLNFYLFIWNIYMSLIYQCPILVVINIYKVMFT